MVTNLEEKTPVCNKLEGTNLHTNCKEKVLAKSADYSTLSLISHASKTMFRIIQRRLETWYIPGKGIGQMFKLGLEKAEEHEKLFLMHTGH